MMMREKKSSLVLSLLNSADLGCDCFVDFFHFAGRGGKMLNDVKQGNKRETKRVRALARMKINTAGEKGWI